MSAFIKYSTTTLLASCLLVGCSSAIGPDGYTYDPWEPVNRKIFAFNDTLDTTLLKPVASVYDTVIPDPIQTGVSNFFGNIEDMGAVVNSLLQLEFKQAAQVSARVINNTIYGLGGIFDVGTALGNNKIYADFGGTLAHYGVESGPFVMLPIFGPSTVRDTIGRTVDTIVIDPMDYVNSRKVAWSKFILKGINQRANLLDLERSVEGSVTDKYTLVRDSWLQHRWGRLYPGERISGQQDAIDAIFAEEQ